MGGLGYQSDAQSSLAVSFNDLRGYATTLHRGLTESYPAYEAIGLRDGEELPAARHDPPADRERVLRDDPAEAHHPPGRDDRCMPWVNAASSMWKSGAWTSIRSLRSASTRT